MWEHRRVREVVVVVFWLWLLTSLSVYGYRIYRRLTRGKQPPEPASTPSVAPAPAAPARSSPTLPPLLSSAPTTDTIGDRAASPAGPADATRPTTPTPPAPPAPTDPATPAGPPTEQSGLFTPSAGAQPPADHLAGGPALSVAEAVSGIQMPCGLAPLVGSSLSLDPRRVVFSTAEATPEAVSTALAAELERLGFAIRSVAHDHAVATKPGAQVTVTIHTDLSAFPTAPPGSVVVTLAT